MAARAGCVRYFAHACFASVISTGALVPAQSFAHDKPTVVNSKDAAPTGQGSAPEPLSAVVPTAPGIFSRLSARPVTFADLPQPRNFVSQHQLMVGKQQIDFRATAAETYVTSIYGEPVARFFSFSYVRQGPVTSFRPVMFIFNGGPGSSSIWLHMGILGPKRVVLTPEINPANTPPFGVIDNPNSILDAVDLVFIDPVGTGFSHAVGNATDLDFAGVDVDAESVARFIEQWLTRNGRWNSPKYILGESYGTLRASVLPRALMGGPMYSGIMRGITVDGVIMVGTATRGPQPPSAGQTEAVQGRNLASLAAAAWYHRRIDRAGRTVEKVYDEALTFGEGEYAATLVKLRAGTLSDAEKQATAAKLAALTGLPPSDWIKAGLSMTTGDYTKRVLAASGQQVGLYDSRYTLPVALSGGDPVADDPAMGRYVPGFIAAFNMMLRDYLKVEMPIPYAPIAFGKLAFEWDYKRAGAIPENGFGGDLAIAMRRTPSLRVLVASGYYDMVTTPANAAVTWRDAALPLERVTYRNYKSGHMLYLGGTAPDFARDIRAFVTRGGAETTPILGERYWRCQRCLGGRSLRHSAR